MFIRIFIKICISIFWENCVYCLGMRNEQAACYAAQAIGYLTGQPGTYKFAFLLLIFISCLFNFFARHLFGSIRARTFTRPRGNGQCQRKFLAFVGYWRIIRYRSGKLWSFSGKCVDFKNQLYSFIMYLIYNL